MAATSTDVKTYENFIDGEWTAPAEGQTEAVLNPATGQTIANAPLSTKEDVDRAVAAARTAFETWSQTTPMERSNALLKLADALEERAEEIGRLEATNAGKPLQAFMDDEVPALVDNLRFFAGGLALQVAGRRRVPRRLHVLDPPRAGRRRRPDRAVELPADDGDLEDRPRAG